MMALALLLSIGSLAACSPPFADQSVSNTELGDLRREAMAGDAQAQYDLGMRYLVGLTVDTPKDERGAEKWFRLAAEQGHRAAQSQLGAMYEEGTGVPQDYREASMWYRLAAEQGDGYGQVRLGVLYEEGKGVTEDDLEAVKWFRLAATQGNDVAQISLGFMFLTGKAVTQDTKEALGWFRRAASQGNAHGMGILGVMYGEGVGVPQDYVRAHMWLNLAAAGGVGDDAIQNRDKMANQLSPAQIAEAQRLARECLASNYQRCGEQGEVRTTPLTRSRR
jgi:TPR repeat protein